MSILNLVQLIIAITAVSAGSHHLPSTLGASPSLIEKYSIITDYFVCLDQSKTIPFSAVNDDYCDCPDGSDEPGTSACPNGQFHCINEGYKGITISSARVNDGICDEECCDGSDEYSGLIDCPNSCESFAIAAKKKADEERRVIQQALAEKNKMVEKGKPLIGTHAKQARALQSKLNGIDTRIGQAQSIKEEASKYKLKWDTFQREMTEQSSLRACPSKLEAYKNALQDIKNEFSALENKYNRLLSVVRHFEKIFKADSVNETITDNQSIKKHPSKRELVAHDTTDEVVQQALLDAFEQWEEDPEMYQYEPIHKDVSFDHLETNEYEEHDVKNLSPCMNPEAPLHLCFAYLWDMAGEVGTNTFSSDTWFKIFQTVKEQIMPGLEGRALVRDPARAQQRLNELYHEKSEIERQLQTAEAKARLDLGPDGVFDPLYGECMDVNSASHVYEVCFMKSVTQKDIGQTWSGGNDLGKFSRWGPRDLAQLTDENKYHNMMYTNGASCGGQLKRSTLVKLVCGGENELVDVYEVETCVYVITMRTPAVCSEHDLTRHDEL